jgi:hypothetical protein
MQAEQWLPVVGWEGLYEVSDRGRVRSLRRPTKVGVRGGRLLRQNVRPDYGYRRVDLTHAGRRSTRTVHTLVAEAFVPNPQGYPLVRHLNGVPGDSRADNLGWGTYAMNVADAQRHGTVPIARHGSQSKYNGGCRCAPCTAANSAADRYRRAHDPAFAARQRETHRRYRARKKETHA